MLPSNVKLVVALDVGTTHSGYAYSFTSSPNDISTCNFKGCPPNSKTPSTVLLNKDGKFVAYGQEAEDKFAEICSSGDISLRLYRNFKMCIHHNNTLSKSTKVSDLTGQHKVSVFDLMVMSVQYLKNHAMRAINRFSGTYGEDDAWFVLLVPAIFDGRAKWFMREVALKAGMTPGGFTLALESEASSLWCQHLNISGIRNPGTRYITVDLGGGTADITAHESLGDGSIDALSSPCGGDWGAITADNSFKAYLTLLFGSSSVDCMLQENIGDWYQIIRNYEESKVSVNDGKPVEFDFTVPSALLKSAVVDKGLHGIFELAEIVKSPNFGGHFKLLGEKLHIDSEASKGLYSYMVNSLAVKLEDLLQKGVITGKNISRVILVGGLANSDLVKGLIKERLKSAHVEFVQESQCFALKGSVLYGHNKNLVKSRIVPVTYGIKSTVPYNNKIHADGQLIDVNGVKMCENNFEILIKAGSKVVPGFEVKDTDKPIRADDKEQPFEIYSCGQADGIPTLTSHCSIHKEASFALPLPYGCLVEDKIFERCVVFGEPEISFKISFQKGKKETFVRSMNYE